MKKYISNIVPDKIRGVNTGREEILTESKKELVDSFPKILVNLAIAVLIWLFGTLVFLPLARALSDPTLFGLIGLDKVISAIILIALVIILFKILNEVKDITDAIAGFVTLYFSEKEASEETLNKYRTAFRGIGYVIVAVVAYLFFLPFLSGIFNVLAGLVLILLLIGAILILIRASSAFSADIEERASKFVRKINELKEE